MPFNSVRIRDENGVLVPLQDPDHWTMAYVDIVRHEMDYFDSYPDVSRKEAANVKYEG
jgi:Ulp1 family protease